MIEEQIDARTGAIALACRGIARDLAAAGLGRLRPREFLRRWPNEVALRAGAIGLRLPRGRGRGLPAVRRPDDPWCPQRARPAWLRTLNAIGLRPISALVDIADYLTYDRYRPLHVFDVDKLGGGIVVRLARPGEELHALDGKT